MPAIAAISLNDAQATPVAHSFAPVNIDASGVAKLADRSSGVALGFGVLSLSLRTPSASNRNYKATARIVVPTLEVTSPSTSTGIQPAPTKAYDVLANLEFVIPERATLQERKNVQAYVKNLLNHAMLTAMIENLETIY